MDKYSEYIDLVKKGDEEAFNVILQAHYRIIYKVINNYSLEKGDFMLDSDNLYQEGCIALYKAIFSYEEDKGMSFSSYAYMCIRSKLSTLIRDSIRRYEEEHYSIDNYPNIDYHLSMSNLCVSENPVAYHHELEFEKKLDKFVSKLNEEDSAIFKMRCEQMSYKQISDRLNINTKRVDNRLRILRNRLKEYLKEDRYNE